MNTPAHGIFNLLILGRRRQPHLVLPLTFGALMPDLPMVLFYAWAKLVLRLPEGVIWSKAYFDPNWQTFFDLFNSIPLLLIAALFAWRLRVTRWLALFGSMILHCLCDLPLHHDDAHRHFFPLSNWRFESPISYWNPAHFGLWIALAEIGLVLVGSVLLWRRFRRPGLRLAVGLLAGSYVVFVGYALMVWVGG